MAVIAAYLWIFINSSSTSLKGTPIQRAGIFTPQICRKYIFLLSTFILDFNFALLTRLVEAIAAWWIEKVDNWKSHSNGILYFFSFSFSINKKFSSCLMLKDLLLAPLQLVNLIKFVLTPLKHQDDPPQFDSINTDDQILHIT